MQMRFLAVLVCLLCAAFCLPVVGNAQGIDAMPADSIDGRGDINDNGQAYEIADFVLMGRALVRGAWNMQKPERGAFHSDVNDDGTAMGLDDWVYLARVTIGDAPAFPRPSLVNDTAVVTHNETTGEVTVGFPHPLAAVLLVFDGEISVTSFDAGVVPDVYYDGRLTRVMIAQTFIDIQYDSIPTFPAGALITYAGNARLIGAAVADAGGLGTVPVDIIGGSDIGRGDINGNNIPYDAADFLDYRDYHLTGYDGLAADTAAVRTASDVNGDGHELTFEDFLHLHRVIMMQASVVDGDRVLPDSAITVVQSFLDRTLLNIRPRNAAALRYQFDRPTTIQFWGDTTEFLVDHQTGGGASVYTILPRLLPDTTSLPTLSDLPISYGGFAILDSVDAAAYRLVRYRYDRPTASVPSTVINDTVYNLITIDHPDPMVGARLVFNGTVSPHLLVDSLLEQTAARNGVTVTSLLPPLQFPGSSFAPGDILTYSGRGYLEVAEVINKYLPNQEQPAEIVITAGPLGDVSMDGSTDVLDISWLVDYIFAGAETPVGIHAADMNRDGMITPVDLAYLVDLIY